MNEKKENEDDFIKWLNKYEDAIPDLDWSERKTVLMELNLLLDAAPKRKEVIEDEGRNI